MFAPVSVRRLLAVAVAVSWLVALGGAARAQVVDLTNPGDLVVGGATSSPSDNTWQIPTIGTGPAGSNTSPNGEQGPNIADNSTASKYLNFGRTNVGVIITPSTSAPIGSIVSGIRFATANDSPARDPIGFTLQGSNDANATTTLNSPWTTIFSGSTGFETDPGRLITGSTINFTNTTPYQSYRWIATSLRDAVAANSMQVSEIDLIGVAAVPEPSSIALCGMAAAGFGWWRRRRRAA